MGEALLYTVRVWRHAGAFRAALQPVGGEPLPLVTDPDELAAFFSRASWQSAKPPGPAAAVPGSALSPRQLDIAQRYARGDTHRQVAQALGLSPATVRNHLSQIYDKLQVRHRAGLIAALAAAPAATPAPASCAPEMPLSPPLRGPHV